MKENFSFYVYNILTFNFTAKDIIEYDETSFKLYFIIFYDIMDKYFKTVVSYLYHKTSLLLHKEI